ncbi:MAG: LysM peptidoglycan-binding domain-containing protein [Alphaproteobacteria bacterium]
MSRPIILALIGVIVVGLAIGLNYRSQQPDVTPPPASTEKAPAKPAITQPTPPTFDVVRINPDGNTVIAGRARPGSVVIIRDGETELGRVSANDRGEWVFVPDAPLAPGKRRLGLLMIAEGDDAIPSIADVIIVVPERGKNIAGQAGQGQALAFRVQPDGTTTVLQKPGGDAGMALSIDAVDYGDDGSLSISGKAAPGSMIQLYLDNDFIGHARTGSDLGNGLGGWSMRPDNRVVPGLYRLRADQIDSDGKVLARVEFPFSRAAEQVEIGDADTIVVQPGNSLWRLARRSYGKGVRYTIIFEANRDQITDADLIYPGQVFKMPKKR